MISKKNIEKYMKSKSLKQNSRKNNNWEKFN